MTNLKNPKILGSPTRPVIAHQNDLGLFSTRDAAIRAAAKKALLDLSKNLVEDGSCASSPNTVATFLVDLDENEVLRLTLFHYLETYIELRTRRDIR